MQSRDDLNNAVNSAKAKDTQGKLPLAWVPSAIIWAIAETRQYGFDHYGPEKFNLWREDDAEHYRHAAYRHWLRYIENPEGLDADSGLPHLYHVAFNVAVLIEHLDKNLKNER